MPVGDGCSSWRYVAYQVGHITTPVLIRQQGIFTLVLGIIAFALMPPSPTQTANWARGKKGWFTER